MARKFLVPIDLSKQELQNARIQNLASAPSSPVVGQIYYDTTVNSIYFWNGSSWVNSASSVAYGTFASRPAASAANDKTLYYATDTALLYVSNGSGWTQVSSFGSGESTAVSITGTSGNGTSTNYARADHTHAGPGFGDVTAQTSYGASSANGSASTVARSDHSHGTPAHTDTEHSGIHLNALAAPTADVSMNSHKLTSVTDPSSAQDAATKNYVDTRKVTDLTAPTSAFSMNSQKITNLATPTADTDAANKGYVDNAISGLDWKTAVHLLADSNIALAGSTNTLVIDGHAALTSAQNGYRLLLKGQSTASENGIYVYQDGGTTYTIVRADDADNYTELVGAAVFVQEGTTYATTAWIQSNHYLSSFSGQVWTQFSGQGTYTASQGVVRVGNDFRFAPSTTGGLETGVGGGAIKLQTNSGLATTSNGLAVGAGTGISVSSGTVAVDTAVVARKYSVAVGDTTNTSYTVTHSLGTRDVMVSVRETASPYAKVEPDIVMTTTSAVTVSFAVAPSTDQYTVTVIG